MPATLRIDTLKFAKELTDAGLTQAQAEAIVRGVSEADTSDLASKADIALLRTDLAELKAATKQDLAELKAELFRFLYVQAITVIGLTVGLSTGLTVTLIKLLP
jgi:hypothetical protein